MLDRKLLRVFALIAPLSVVWAGCEGQPDRAFYDDSEGGSVGEAAVDAPALRPDTAPYDASSTGDESSSGGGPEASLADAPDSGGNANDGAAADSGGTGEAGGPDSGPNDSGCVNITHNGGYGVTYYDCEPAGTDDLQAAIDACTVYTGNASDCPSFGCKADPVRQGAR